MINVVGASNEHGEIVRALIAQSPWNDEHGDLDYSTLAPYWLLALHDGKAVGTIQMSFGRPLARLEYMAIDESIKGYEKAQIVRALLDAGAQILISQGAERVTGFIPFELKTYRRVLERRGARIAGKGTLMTWSP